MKQIFARVTALICGYLAATAFIAVFNIIGTKGSYTSSLWQVAPWTLVVYLIAGGLIWGINNWDSR